MTKVLTGNATCEQSSGVAFRLIYHVFFYWLIAAFMMASLAGCAGRAPKASQATIAAETPVVGDYRLGSGDRVRLIVFSEPDLSGEFDVDGSGTVSLPLIGQVSVLNLTLREFESRVAEKLKEGYLADPKVSAEVMNYRPFYIFGEVTNPGEYPFTNGMTVLNAVAVAGGFSYRADTGRALISRGEVGEVEYPISPQVKILPGDVVRIPERFF